MYLPTHFAETNQHAIRDFVRRHPLGQLVRMGPAGLTADALPFELASAPDADGERDRLRAHVARANALWREADGTSVLVIFSGPSGYVTPNSYPSKQETGRAVPTWNYQIVHAHGVLRVRDDERFLRGLVARLTRVHEASAGEARPWRMGDAPSAYIDEMLRAIVGIEVEVERWVAKFKLSQNRDARDRAGVISRLEARGEQALALAVAAAQPPHEAM